MLASSGKNKVRKGKGKIWKKIYILKFVECERFTGGQW